jgi:hypothetical protein
LTAFIFHGTKEKRVEQRPQVGRTDVTITTYEVASLEKSTIAKVHWEYIIIDEAHRIKNECSLLAENVRHFKSNHRLLLTGTPLQNNLHELWALLNYLLPTVFDNASEFSHAFDVTMQSGKDQNIIKKLHGIIRPFILRRLKSDVEKSLLPKVETQLYVGLSAMQREWYTNLLVRNLDLLNANNTNKMRILNILMQLRKVCNHPYLFNGAEPGPPYSEGEHLIENAGKMVLLDKLLSRLQAQGSRVLIFSQMTRVLDILEDFCRWKCYNYCRIDGSTKQDERYQAMDDFNREGSEKFVFLLSTRAGGLGINLQTADIVILYDSDWNPQMDLQAQDRAHRIGQKKQVHVYRFVTEGTVEEKIVERAMKKLYLDALVVGQGRLQNSETKLKAAEMASMVRFGADLIFQSKGATITDEDIDQILSRGKSITEEAQAKLTRAGYTLDNFTFNDTGSFQSFDGKDYSAAGRANEKKLLFFEPTKRVSKTVFGREEFINSRVNEKGTTLKAFKPVQRSDFQFHDRGELEKLERKAWEAKQLLKQIKQNESVVLRERRKRRKEALKEQKRREQAEAAATAAVTTIASGDGGALPAADISMEVDMDVKKTAQKLAKAEAKQLKLEAKKLATAAKAKRVAEAKATKELKQKTAQLKKSEKVAFETKSEAAESDEENGSESGAGEGSDGAEASEEEVEGSESEEEEEEEDSDAESDSDEEDAAAREARQRREAGCLTPEEAARKAKLESEGFSSWNRRNFQNYIAACTNFGKENIGEIARAVDGQSEAAVRKYHTVFWKRCKELKDYVRLIKQIERGAERRAKLESMNDVFAAKVKRSGKTPLVSMTIPYGAGQKVWTEEEDRFLVVHVAELGFGEWDALQQAIRQAFAFRFDWFIKSRTVAELQKRVDYLYKLLEKEQTTLKEKKSKKRKPESGKVNTVLFALPILSLCFCFHCNNFLVF